MSVSVSSILEVCVRILESPHSTLELNAAVGRLIVADAEFNERFYVSKQAASQESLLAGLDGYDVAIRRSLVSWDAFSGDPSGQSDRLLKDLREIAELLSVLTHSS